MKLKKPLTLSEIAKIIDVKLDGEPNFIITGLNEIHNVEKGDLTFVDHQKYYGKAINSVATAILIDKKLKSKANKTFIFSDNPFRDYNILTNYFSKFEKCDSLISKKAKIGKGTILQPGVFIGNNVEIGKNCLIHSNISIYDSTIIGNNVIIHANTVIGADAFYYKKCGERYNKLISCGGVIIEDNVEIGANCTIDRGVSRDTIIGKGTKMDNLIQIGHDTIIGKNCLFASQVGVAGIVIIEDDVVLWGQVGVQKDLTIGKGALVLGQSGVAKSIKGNKVYLGSPVSEAKKKMKEIAYLKRIPDLFMLLKK